MGMCTFHLGNKRKKITFNFVYGNKFHNKEKLGGEKEKVCKFVQSAHM